MALPDGTVVRVHGAVEMDAKDREMFAILVAAARRLLAAEHPEVACGNAASGLSISQCQARPEGCSCFPAGGYPDPAPDDSARTEGEGDQ